MSDLIVKLHCWLQLCLGRPTSSSTNPLHHKYGRLAPALSLYPVLFNSQWNWFKEIGGKHIPAPLLLCPLIHWRANPRNSAAFGFPTHFWLPVRCSEWCPHFPRMMCTPDISFQPLETHNIRPHMNAEEVHVLLCERPTDKYYTGWLLFFIWFVPPPVKTPPVINSLHYVHVLVTLLVPFKHWMTGLFCPYIKRCIMK